MRANCIFDDGRGGFGFRRLSIIDLSQAGHQPMHGCTRSSLAGFQRRDLQPRRLREGLEERGHVYASRTDSETILHLYEERGLDFVNDIEGDFGIALWDAEREQLVLVARSHRRQAALFLPSKTAASSSLRRSRRSSSIRRSLPTSMKSRSIIT